MRFDVGPAFTAVEGRISPSVIQALDGALAYHPKGYSHDPRYQRHVWDGFERLLRRPRGGGGRFLFPSGLLEHALRAVAPLCGPVEVIRDYSPLPLAPAQGNRLPGGQTLRPEQIEAVERASQAQQGLLNLSVAFGKTLVMAGVLVRSPEAALVLVPGQELSRQVALELEGYLQEPVGYLGGGQHRFRGRITVATPQALAHAGDRQAALLRTPILLVDEVHTVSLKTWVPLLGAHQAPMRLGFSGTIKEAHAPLLVESFFGPILMTVTEKQQAAAGYISKATVLMPWVRSEFAIGYGDLYEASIVRNAERNGVLVEGTQWAVDRGWPTLIHVYKLDHGADLARRLDVLGIPHRWLYHGVPGIPEAKRAFEAGHLPVIIASNIFGLGINLPSIRFLVNAAAWQNPLVTSQRAGRGLRLKPDGVHEVTILDPFDLGTDLLKKHSVSREHTYRRKGFTVRTGFLSDLLAGTEPTPMELDSMPNYMGNCLAPNP